MLFRKIKKYIEDIGFTICKNSEQEGFFIVESDADSIRNLIIGVAPPVIIFEQYLFTLQSDNLAIFKALLMKNRDIIHGGFALTEDGKKVIFRYTLQAHNIDQNEFDAAINSLSLLLSEYYEQLIAFSKN
ncbi:MAG TPA: hypothetical protein VKZ57_10590 [Sphingobacterium sp.]|jgi:hypothetical protein|nr:hypothetical protein [Sphingobacterium sp.]